MNTKTFALERGSYETLPSRKAIVRYFDFGGKRISVGSDAHTKEELGSGVKEAFDFLKRNSPRGTVLLF